MISMPDFSYSRKRSPDIQRVWMSGCVTSRYTRQRVSSCHKEAIVFISETMESLLEALVMINQPA
jgi:hypothetical protein